MITLRDVWAKSPSQEGKEGESLVEHTYRVLLALRAVLAKYSPPDETCREWLFWGAVLHDLGKAAKGFQARVRGLRNDWGAHRHEVLSLAFLDWLVPKEEEAARKWIAAIVLSHHKENKDIQQLYSVYSSGGIREIMRLVQELDERQLEAVHQWVTEIVPTWKQVLGFGPVRWDGYPVESFDSASFYARAVDSMIEALTNYDQLVYSLADQKNKNEVLLGTFLRGAILLSDHRASAGVFRFKALPESSQRSLLPLLNRKEAELYNHQKRAWGEAGSVVVISPTGSGKTETALLWGIKQRGSIFYLLPYQASMNAMYQRLNSYFPGKVGLDHSKVVQAHYRRLMEQDMDERQSAIIAKKLKSLVRLDQYPIRVTSPYQLLKAMFRVKGYESLLLQLQNSSIVVDEIHAYDVKRTAMLVKMFGYLQKTWNVRFLFMSATFPGMLLEMLKREVQIEQIISADEHFYMLARRHRVFVKEADLLAEESVSCILKRVARGENVLIVCNTVERAQRMYDTIKKSGLSFELFLLHGRLHGKDRQKVEHVLMKKMQSPFLSSIPMVLVATQAVEVSLDVSFDVGFTDPAPLEALLQRFGRVNRKPFPPVEPKDVFVYSQPTRFDGIYDEEEVVRALHLLLCKGNGFIINESEVSSWLDNIYSGSVLYTWMETYQDAAIRFQRTIVQELVPFFADTEIADEFYEQFDSVPVLASNLLEEYRSVAELSPLAAEELLVTVRWKTYQKYKAQPYKSPHGMVRMVRVPYLSEYGLQM